MLFDIMFFMTNERNKYKSHCYQIAGFAMFAPIGNIFIEPAVVFNQFNPKIFVLYLFFTLTLVAIGFILVDKGLEFIE